MVLYCREQKPDHLPFSGGERAPKAGWLDDSLLLQLLEHLREVPFGDGKHGPLRTRMTVWTVYALKGKRPAHRGWGQPRRNPRKENVRKNVGWSVGGWGEHRSVQE